MRVTRVISCTVTNERTPAGLAPRRNSGEALRFDPKMLRQSQSGYINLFFQANKWVRLRMFERVFFLGN